MESVQLLRWLSHCVNRPSKLKVNSENGAIEFMKPKRSQREREQNAFFDPYKCCDQFRCGQLSILILCCALCSHSHRIQMSSPKLRSPNIYVCACVRMFGRQKAHDCFSSVVFYQRSFKLTMSYIIITRTHFARFHSKLISMHCVQSCRSSVVRVPLRIRFDTWKCQCSNGLNLTFVIRISFQWIGR